MRLPLIQPVDIVIHPVLKGETETDPRRREPTRKIAYGPPVVLSVQQYYTKLERRNPEREGNNPDSSGSCTTRQWILDDAEYVFTTGDKITEVAGRTLPNPVYVDEWEPSAHLDGENTLVVIRWRSKALTRTN